MAVTNVFGKRDCALPDVFVYDTLPKGLRVQLVLLFEDTLLCTPIRSEHQYRACEYLARIVSREFKRFSLSGCENSIEDIKQCILESEDHQIVLAIVEQIVKWLLGAKDQVSDGYCWDDPQQVEDTVTELNHRFRENGVGYAFDENLQQIIRLDSTLLHESAIRPTLSVLTEASFASANNEFRIAFDDYKKGDFSDCVVKSCAAFESVLKIICDDKGWKHDPKDTCAKLVEIVVRDGKLEGFLSEPFKLIGMIRNRKSIAHGAGTVVKEVSESMARYCLNATASAILFVVESTK